MDPNAWWITGFGPFGEHRWNPSGLLASRVAAAIARRRVLVSSLDVTWVEARRGRAAAYFCRSIHFGLAADRDGICVETAAWRDPARVADVSGRLPPGSPEPDRAPDPVRTRCDTAALVDSIRRRTDFAVRLSEDPGRYVCNALYRAALGANPRSLFIHVPMLSPAEVGTLAPELAASLCDVFG